jgi:hypothetical protein
MHALESMVGTSAILPSPNRIRSKMSDKKHWTKPLARQLGGRATWQALEWGEAHLELTSSRGISVAPARVMGDSLAFTQAKEKRHVRPR